MSRFTASNCAMLHGPRSSCFSSLSSSRVPSLSKRSLIWVQAVSVIFLSSTLKNYRGPVDRLAGRVAGVPVCLHESPLQVGKASPRDILFVYWGLRGAPTTGSICAQFPRCASRDIRDAHLHNGDSGGPSAPDRTEDGGTPLSPSACVRSTASSAHSRIPPRKWRVACALSRSDTVHVLFCRRRFS